MKGTGFGSARGTVELVGQRRPYRVIFEADQEDGTVRQGTVTATDLDTARREARTIARDGKPAEIHYVTECGQRRLLERYRP
jgi:hypothetical protein